MSSARWKPWNSGRATIYNSSTHFDVADMLADMNESEDLAEKYHGGHFHKNPYTIVLSGIFIIVALIGNGLSMLVMRKPSFKKHPHCSILFVLAISDIVGALTASNSVHLWEAFSGTYLHNICVVFKYPQYTSCMYSQLLLTFFTFERFFAVRYPMKAMILFDQKRTNIVIFVMGAVCIVINTYIIVIHKDGCGDLIYDGTHGIFFRIFEMSFALLDCFFVLILNMLIIYDLRNSTTRLRDISRKLSRKFQHRLLKDNGKGTESLRQGIPGNSEDLRCRIYTCQVDMTPSPGSRVENPPSPRLQSNIGTFKSEYNKGTNNNELAKSVDNESPSKSLSHTLSESRIKTNLCQLDVNSIENSLSESHYCTNNCYTQSSVAGSGKMDASYKETEKKSSAQEGRLNLGGCSITEISQMKSKIEIHSCVCSGEISENLPSDVSIIEEPCISHGKESEHERESICDHDAVTEDGRHESLIPVSPSSTPTSKESSISLHEKDTLKSYMSLDEISLKIDPGTSGSSRNLIEKMRDSPTMDKAHLNRIQQARRVTIMLVFTSLYFVVSTLPIYIYYVVCLFKSIGCMLDENLFPLRFVQNSNYAINFFLYVLLGPSFRQEIKRMAASCRKLGFREQRT